MEFCEFDLHNYIHDRKPIELIDINPVQLEDVLDPSGSSILESIDEFLKPMNDPIWSVSDFDYATPESTRVSSSLDDQFMNSLQFDWGSVISRLNHSLREPGFNPALLSENSGWPLKLLNIWTIMNHLASGLVFLHSHGHVHRDLKPRNGTSILLIWI
jgi:serine/threonine protein kinase